MEIHPGLALGKRGEWIERERAKGDAIRMDLGDLGDFRQR